MADMNDELYSSGFTGKNVCCDKESIKENPCFSLVCCIQPNLCCAPQQQQQWKSGGVSGPYVQGPGKSNEQVLAFGLYVAGCCRNGVNTCCLASG